MQLDPVLKRIYYVLIGIGVFAFFGTIHFTLTTAEVLSHYAIVFMWFVIAISAIVFPTLDLLSNHEKYGEYVYYDSSDSKIEHVNRVMTGFSILINDVIEFTQTKISEHADENNVNRDSDNDIESIEEEQTKSSEENYSMLVETEITNHKSGDMEQTNDTSFVEPETGDEPEQIDASPNEGGDNDSSIDCSETNNIVETNDGQAEQSRNEGDTSTEDSSHGNDRDTNLDDFFNNDNTEEESEEETSEGADVSDQSTLSSF